MNTPLRDELIERLAIGHVAPADPSAMKQYLENTYGPLADEILNLIASKMPEKLEVDSENHNHMTEAQYQFIVGKNEALTEVKSILKGGTE